MNKLDSAKSGVSGPNLCSGGLGVHSTNLPVVLVAEVQERVDSL